MELEGRVRRAAAERGAVELKKNEFQGELEKQREQLDKIQSSHNFQMESVNRLHQDEKARPRVVSVLRTPASTLGSSSDGRGSDVVILGD